MFQWAQELEDLFYDFSDDGGDSDGEDTEDWLEEDPNIYAPPIAAKWRPLKNWFTKVAGLFSSDEESHQDAHPVRIGHVSKDLWIDVKYKKDDDDDKGSDSDEESDEDDEDIHVDELRDNDEDFGSDSDEESLEDADEDANTSMDVEKGQAPLNAQEIDTYRAVRESILIMSVLAQADYYSFLGGFVRWANYRTPPYFHFNPDPETPQTTSARKFRFCVPSGAKPVYYGWSALKNLFAIDSVAQDVSDEFTTSFKELCGNVTTNTDQAAVAAWRRKLCEPVLVKLVVSPEAVTLVKQVTIIKNLRDTVMGIQAAEQDRRRQEKAQDTGSFLPPPFHLDCLELDLRNFQEHPSVWKALQELLETGVHVPSLTLPGRPTRRDSQQIHASWYSLVASALGVRQLLSVRARVDRIVLPDCYSSESYLIPFCSAMATTPVLKSVRIEMGSGLRDDEEAQRRTWAWLGYALFSSSARNTVEKLDLDGFKLTSATIKELSDRMNASNPLVALWESTTGKSSGQSNSTATTTNSIVTVKEGATLTLESCIGGDVQATMSWAGTIINLDASTLHLLVPGVGLCAVDRVSVAPVVSTPPPSPLPVSCITTLIVGTPMTNATMTGRQEEKSARDQKNATWPLLELLGLIGSQLTALALDIDNLNDVVIAKTLLRCPRLKSLRIRGAILPSMDVFMDAYQRPSCRVSSLDLHLLHVPIERFEEFLQRLGEEDSTDPMVGKLERLRIGRGWSHRFRTQTDDILEDMLDRNRRLTHFHLYTRMNVESRPPWDPFQDQGQGLVEAPLLLDQKLAFLSVLKRLGQPLSPTTTPSAAALLPNDTIAPIFKLATAFRWRFTYVQRDLEGSMMQFVLTHLKKFTVHE